MNLKHLPQAPWRISGFEVQAGGTDRVVMSEDGYGVAWISGRSVEEHEAIAQVIAAVPEMLAALQEEELAQYEFRTHGDNPVYQVLRRSADAKHAAGIAKAAGK